VAAILTAIRPEAEIDSKAINHSPMQGLVRPLSVRQKLCKNRRSCYIFPVARSVARVGGWKKENRNLSVCDAWSGQGRVDRKREENLI
jgi:hypothetical protein